MPQIDFTPLEVQRHEDIQRKYLTNLSDPLYRPGKYGGRSAEREKKIDLERAQKERVKGYKSEIQNLNKEYKKTGQLNPEQMQRLSDLRESAPESAWDTAKDVFKSGGPLPYGIKKLMEPQHASKKQALKDFALGTGPQVQRFSNLNPEQEKFIGNILEMIGPQLQERLSSMTEQHKKPAIEQLGGLFGPQLSGALAGLAGSGLASMGTSQPQFASFGGGSGSNISPMLMSALGGLAGSQYGPQIQQGASQLGQGISQAGSSTMDYLRNLLGR